MCLEIFIRFSWYLYTLSRKPVLFLFVTSVLFLTVLLFHVPIVAQYLSHSLLILFISFILCPLSNFKPVDLNTFEWNQKVIYSPHFIHWKCNWKQILLYTTYTNCTIISETKKMGFDMCTEILEYNTTCIWKSVTINSNFIYTQTAYCPPWTEFPTLQHFQKKNSEYYTSHSNIT